jgi:enoyl-CoA hydratase/carnithine racemase
MATDGEGSGSYPACPGLRSELAGGVLQLVIDRPDKRNSLTDEMVEAMIGCLARASGDESVRVVELTATGTHFCSGFDIVARNQAGGPGPGWGASSAGSRTWPIA